ncbi:MAG: BTAD domain-containing putative transcriptional regulator [Anaerolineae bacterium]
MRRALNDRDPLRPYLLTTPQSIEFNADSDYWLDVTAFTALLNACESHPHLEAETCALCAERMTRAVELYRGGFMAGFSAPGCVELEEWVLMKQEELHNSAVSALSCLTDYHLAVGNLAAAGRYAGRQLEMEPWREEAHRQRMQALAQSGQFSAALHQYEACKRVLADSLSIEPAAKTARLAEDIRNQMVADTGAADGLPASRAIDARHAAERKEGPPPAKFLASPLAGCGALFAGRENELFVLNGLLDEALKDHGQVIFVTGEAGSGKTALVTEFARRAAAAHPNLVVAAGSCSAYGGAGDPYQPFVEILRMLGHGVELETDSGCGHQWAERLRAASPVVSEAFLQHAADLVSNFMPMGTARNLATQGRPARVNRPDGGPEVPDPEGAGANRGRLPGVQLFAQITEGLRAVAQSFPLLLIVEDLQWADNGTIGLLFHLERRLGGSKLLLVGTYRAEDVAHGHETGRHPLEALVNEFQRDSALVPIDLNLADGRKFVDAFLDVQPTRLGSAFREKIYHFTEGHPLFMIELLHSLQERGSLQRDPDGRWIEGPHLDWRCWPPRVEAVIAERFERLPEAVRELLEVASVAGDEFIAEVVADVLGVDERRVLRWLNGSLSQQDGLVRPHRLQRLGQRQLSHYRFRHHLFQSYLYQGLSEMARAQLHERVGAALETLYAGSDERMSALSTTLAWHFEMAGMADKAVDYLEKAGNRAVELSAYEDAIVHFQHALHLLWRTPDSAERARLELRLQFALATAVQGRPVWGDVGAAGKGQSGPPLAAPGP